MRHALGTPVVMLMTPDKMHAHVVRFLNLCEDDDAQRVAYVGRWSSLRHEVTRQLAQVPWCPFEYKGVKEDVACEKFALDHIQVGFGANLRPSGAQCFDLRSNDFLGAFTIQKKMRRGLDAARELAHPDVACNQHRL